MDGWWDLCYKMIQTEILYHLFVLKLLKVTGLGPVWGSPFFRLLTPDKKRGFI